MKLQNYRHILWDWNGTLLDDVDLCIGIINGILCKRNLSTVDRSKYLEVFDFPVQHYYARLGFDFSSEPFELLSNEYISAYNEQCSICLLNKDAIQVLEHVKGRGIPQSILSAAHTQHLEEMLQFFGIRNYFTAVAGLDNSHAAGKESIGHAIVSTLGIPVGEILMIGDTIHDAAVAQALGCDCILVAGGHQSKERLKKTGFPVLSSLVDLLVEQA